MKKNLIWLDLEMTGLDPTADTIIEIATVVTDSDLNELAVGPVYAIEVSEQRLQSMDAWNKKHHTASGLWRRVLEQGVDLQTAEQQTLAFLSDWAVAGASPMCGNSICQDRRFLARYMPALEAYFHYRNLDVSTVKELLKRWASDTIEPFIKMNKHEALCDIRESIAELRYYRENFFITQ